MSGELPAPLTRFVELFNRGEYWESHEALEDAWRATDSGFYQGLILFASAFVHARRGTRHGILAQLDKAERTLEPYRPAHLGVDVEAILAHAARCRDLVAPREAPPAGREWADVVPFPTLSPDPAGIRGDEPELEAG